MRGSKLIAKVLVCVLMLSMVFSNISIQTVNAATPEKKEKFILKHADNERMRDKFFPDLVDGSVQNEVTTDAAITVETNDLSVEPGPVFEEVSSDVVSVEATVEELQDYLSDPEVYQIENDQVVSISGDIYPSNLQIIGEESIIDDNFTGKGVKIAILDTGIDIENVELNVTGGVSFIEGTTYDDDNGHGTALAGIIAAKADGTGIIGMAPEAELYAVKVLDSTGHGYYSDVIKGLEWCVSNEIDIVLMSFGSDNYSDILREKVEEVSRNEILMIGAAGNTSGEVQFPAAFNEVVAVGAVDYNNYLMSYSNTGEAIDLVSLGMAEQVLGNGGIYSTAEGTSVSAAHLVGLAAELKGNAISSSVEDIKGILYNSTIPYSDRLGYGNGVISADLVYENRNNTYEVIQNDIQYDITKALTVDGEMYISFKHPSYDNQVISTGQKVTVRAGFYDDHEECVITLYKSGDESNPLDTHIRPNIVGLAGDDSEPIYTSNYVTYTTPTMTEAGTYKIRYHCPDNNTSDWDDVFTFTVTSDSSGGDDSSIDPTLFPDLIPTDITIKNVDGSIPTKYFENENKRVFVELENSGDASFSGNIDIEFYVNGTKELSKTISVNLSKNDTVTEEITFHSPVPYVASKYWNTPSASTSVNLKVKLVTSVTEKSDTNNNFTDTITTDMKPNLEVYKRDFEIPQSYSMAGEMVNAQIKIENSGGSESGAFDVVVKKSDGTTVATKRVNNIVNGLPQTVTIPMTLEETFGAYEYFIELENFTYPNSSSLNKKTIPKKFEVGEDDNEDLNNNPNDATFVPRTSNNFTEIFGSRKYKTIESYIHENDVDWYEVEVVNEDKFLLVSLISPYKKSGSTILYDENYIVELYKYGKFLKSEAVAQSVSTYTRNYFRYEIDSVGTYFIKVSPQSSSDYSVEHGYQLEIGVERLDRIYGSEGEGWQTKDDDDNDYVTEFPVSFSLDSTLNLNWGTVNGYSISYADILTDFQIDSTKMYLGSTLTDVPTFEDGAFDIWNDASIDGAPEILFDIDTSSTSSNTFSIYNDSKTSVGGSCSVNNGIIKIDYNSAHMSQANISMPTCFSEKYEFFKAVIAHELGHAIGLRDLYVRSKDGYTDGSGNLIDNTEKLMYGYNNRWNLSLPDYLSSEDVYGVQVIQGWKEPVTSVNQNVIYASYVGYSDDELYNEADAIVRVKVFGVGTFAGDGVIPKSIISGTVIDCYKDTNSEIGDAIQFLQDGTSEDILMSNRLFEVGDEAIVFLKKADDTYYILGGPQGRYDVEDKLEGVMAINHLEQYVNDELFFTDATMYVDIEKDIAEFEDELNNNILLSKPVITYTITPEPNMFGWNNEAVVVDFSAKDELYEITFISDTKIFDEEGKNQSVIGLAINEIGQSSNIVVSGVNIDKTAPVVSLNAQAPVVNKWYNNDMQINVDITEELSGLSSVEYQIHSQPEYESQNFADATNKLLEIMDEGMWYLTIQLDDKADNTTVQTFGPFMLDKTAPVINYQGLTEYICGTAFEVAYLVEDNLSGVASTCVYIDGVQTEQDNYVFEQPGNHEIRIETLDNAGNKTSFMQEINVLLPITANIDPESLNLQSGQKGKAQITVELVFPEGYDIAMIIADSISINGSAYSESSDKYGYVKNPISYDEQGNAVYMVKFYRSDLSNILIAGENHICLRGKTHEYDFIWEGNVTVK